MLKHTLALQFQVDDLLLRVRYVLISILGILTLISTPLYAQVIGADRSFLKIDLGLSILGETGNRENLARSYALGVRGGLRWGSWGGFLQIEPAYWLVAKPDGDSALQGAINLGLGGEYLYADGLIRTALSAGPSFLVTSSEIDTLGSRGFYFELRPAGLRWQINTHFVLGFDPIILSIMVPVLEGIPLIELEYRTVVIGEYVF